MRVACLQFSQELKLAEFAEACVRFSPQLSLREPNTLFIEIGKCRTLYSETSFIARAQVLLRRFGLTARIGIADDIPTAAVFARFGTPAGAGKSGGPVGIDSLPLEILTEYGDPFGRDPDGRQAILKMVDSLERLGIKTIAQFKTLPISHFPSRFGSLGLHCRQRLEDGGTQNLPWPHWEPPETFTERVELLPSEFCADLEPLLFKSKEILDRIFSRLRGRFLRADRMAVRLELEKYSTVKNPLRAWTFDFIAPQGSTVGFMPMLRERLNWDLQKEPIESYVIAMTVEVLAHSAGNANQNHFFHSRGDSKEEMGSFFGQIEEYLGKGQVFWAQVTEERLPETSWAKSRLPDPGAVDLNGRYPRRPTRIFARPLSITVIQDRLVLKGRTYKIAQWSAVERLSLNWLDDSPARNYYQVDLDSGTRLWVFTDPGHHYFVHGYYE